MNYRELSKSMKPRLRTMIGYFAWLSALPAMWITSLLAVQIVASLLSLDGQGKMRLLVWLLVLPFVLAVGIALMGLGHRILNDP